MDKPKSLDEFRASKREMSIKDFCELIGEDPEDYKDTKSLLVYATHYYIEVGKEGYYDLNYVNVSLRSKNLAELEEKFWDDFVKWEIVPQRDIYKDLKNRNKDLINKLDYLNDQHIEFIKQIDFSKY